MKYFSFLIAISFFTLQVMSADEQSPPRSSFVHVDKIHINEFHKDRFFVLTNFTGYSEIEVINDFSQVILDFQLECDGMFLGDIDHSADLKKRSFPLPNLNAVGFALRPGHTGRYLLGSQIKNCILRYRNREGAPQWGSIQLVSEAVAYPFLEPLVKFDDQCPRPVPDVFAQLTCQLPTGTMEPLESPEAGFFAKTEMLLGQNLSQAFLNAQDPFAPIDFSKAPQLKAIFLSTLVFRADFYGHVMARLLKFHADRGTPVFIITTEYMMLEKDKKLLYNLAKNGHIRLQEFIYNDPHYDLGRPFRYIDTKYRDMHVKLLITLSTNAQRNAVVIGGRNIHDGFLFRKIPDMSRFSEVVQYGVDEDFVHWSDFEMKVTSGSVAEKLAAHLLRLWNRDSSTQILYPFGVNGPAQQVVPEHKNLQHILSLPYNDDRALETLFVQLIDSAKHRIRLSSPYLRPTPELMSALVRAAARKVDVIIQTRVSLKGDTQAWLYEEVNKESINKLYNKVKIYQWQEDSILHSKFLLIDDDVGFIGSVNLSRRSFIQDVESGLIIHDKAYIERMGRIFDSYLSRSTQITTEEQRKFFPTLLILLLQDQF